MLSLLLQRASCAFALIFSRKRLRAESQKKESLISHRQNTCRRLAKEIPFVVCPSTAHLIRFPPAFRFREPSNFSKGSKSTTGTFSVSPL
jgi:hypothetical protein